MRIAFFGGTFDPPHRGHIAVAHAAIARLALDRVLVAPVAAQPLKVNGDQSSFEDRLAMVRLAVHDDPQLIASDADAPRPGGEPNYTLDTLAGIKRTLTANDVLFCLLGADSMLSLKRWHRAAELLLFCDFIVAGRPGFSLEQIPATLPQGIQIDGWRREPEYVCAGLSDPGGRNSTLYLLPDLEEHISATEIRAALANGSETQTLLAPEVAGYIRAHGLYRPT